MADRYQPGASLLSFLNPRSIYYTEYGQTPQKLAETKAALADALLDNKKDPSNVLKLTPTEKAAVKEVVKEVKAELPPSIAPEPAKLPPPKPAAAPPAPNPVKELPPAAVPKAVTPTEVKAAIAEAKAEAKAEATASAASGTATLNVNAVAADQAKKEAKAIAEVVKNETVAPGVEAKGAEAKAVDKVVDAAVKKDGYCPCDAYAWRRKKLAQQVAQQQAAAQAKKEGYCPCEALAWKRKKAAQSATAATTGEQAKKVAEGFFMPKNLMVIKGPSKFLSNLSIAGVNIKDALTGGNKPKAAKDKVEKFCDNHWHGIASTIVVLLSLVIMLILCLGVFGLLHVVFDIRKGPVPTPASPTPYA